MVDLLKEEFEKIKERYGPAWSFPPGEKAPNDAREIYREKQKWGDSETTVIYYMDDDNNLYYEDLRTTAFDKHMKELERIRRIRKRAGL